MIRVNLATGRTLSFDLTDEEGLRRWEVTQADPAFQREVRGVQLVAREDGRDRVVCAFRRPRTRGTVVWEAEVIRDGGRAVREAVTCYFEAHAVTLSLFLGRDPVVATVDTTRRGRLVLRPSATTRTG